MIDFSFPVPEALIDQVAEVVLSRMASVQSWPEWMSVETAARYLDVPVERIRKLKDRGALPFYQEAPGCRVFFRRSELDKAMEVTRAR